MQDQNKNTYPHEEEFVLRQVLKNRRDDFFYLWKYRIKILIACVIGAIFGVLLAWKWPISYTSRLTFIVEEARSGGGSLAALAGQFGFDIGTLSSANTVLAGDNVQGFLRSHTLIKRTLLSPYAADSGYTLADRYAESSHLKKRWARYYKKGGEARFPANRQFTRLQDSLINDMVERIIAKDLIVSKPDKKLGFFEVNITMRDEKLSQQFCIRLINAAADFYIQTKTKKIRNNVNRLQTRADSITRVLNGKTYSASAATQITLDANPAYPTSNVGAEVQEREKNVLTVIYSDVTKQLESSRMMLIQETPTFQIVDEPEIPLKKNELDYLVSIILCTGIAALIFSLYLLIRKSEVFSG